MAFVSEHTRPAVPLTQDILRRINALGHEPRVVIELDKIAYVPGMKNKFEVWDRIYTSSVEYVATDTVVGSYATTEPTNIVSGGESGNRFEYIKCAFDKWCKHYGLPKQAYYFLLAVCKHETAFGTLGQGRPEKGSYIVGYGCPGSCDPAYSGIDTQAKYAAKRYYDAMRSRFNAIEDRGHMTADDIDYFHQGGDKGYNKYVWSADGPNWKAKVKQYYDRIRSEALMSSKWNCTANSGYSPAFRNNVLNFSEDIEDCGCDKQDVYTIEEQLKEQSIKAGNIAHNSTVQGGIVFPIEGMSFSGDAKISSGWGYRGGEFHRGIDITSKSSGSAGVNGKWVVAVWDGEVIAATKHYSYGNYVILKHPNGYYSTYAHMQNGSLQVRKGQFVKQGTRLGKVGSTGNSTGPHLHFELHKGERTSANNLNPYPILAGLQQISAGITSSDTNVPQMKVTTNIKFNKCFTSDGYLSSDWVDKENVKHFSVAKTGEKYIGFTPSNVSQGTYSSFGYRHNFSADGYYEYSYYCDLGEGDEVVVSLDGMVVKRYTKANNTSYVATEPPIYVQFTNANTPNANSHILDITIHNASGKAVFGIKCFKVAEIEVVHGSVNVNWDITARKRDEWIETGGFVYERTFILEDDVLEWEVNAHYDMRSATASFTLDNKHGIYSPTYERLPIFPENKRESEMTYYELGEVRHVLSEGTPVRIYAGYGDNLVRVFTGRIKGEIQQDSEQKTITVKCVDMYDMLEEHVFDRILTFPRRDEISTDGANSNVMWVKSAIVHNIVNEAGLIGWRIVEDDLRYPDAVIEETYYIDIDRGGKTAVVWDANKQQYVVKTIQSVKDIRGYLNPYVQAIDFPEGTRAADAIQEVIGEIMYRAYCDRYGTFRLENIRNINASNAKWEFIDGENIQSLTTSIDHSRVRNHLLIEGSGGQVDHFIDKDLLIATKGIFRTAKIQATWIDESYGSNAKGVKEEVAQKLFFDMKRMARTLNVVVKGNPMIDILDGVYIYDRNTSTVGYFIVKGNRLVGSKEGMYNQLELTWKDDESYSIYG